MFPRNPDKPLSLCSSLPGPNVTVGGLVSVLDGEGILKRSGGDSMFLYKCPIDTVDLGSRVNDCSGVDIFHSERGDNEFHFNVQRVLSSRSTKNGSGEFLRRNSSPF